MKCIYAVILFPFFLHSCQSRNKKEDALFSMENITRANLQTITVEVEDFNFEDLGNFLEVTSYIQLAAEPLLASIQEIQIKNEKIYIHDKFARIICYDMQGKMIFKIDAKGAGPGEYTDVNTFVINEQSRELIIYDNHKQSLLFYNADNGIFFKTQKLVKPDPTAMASLGGVYYYDNRYHSNYPNDTDLYYSLLVSKNAMIMDRHYFPHNDAESSYRFRPTRQPFSYNDSVLYYCRNFDNVIYELNPDSLKALYKIMLPDPLPFSKIENKINGWELVKSKYSLGLESIYKCNNLLYFQFSKDGFLQSALYDLIQEKQIYCGKRLTDKVGKSVPIFQLIDGVYKGQFWGVLTPETIGYALSKEPKDYADIFRKYDPDTDNPIISFFKVVQ